MTQDNRKVKIILIGGIPGVGKSSISGYIARQTGIDIVLSGDYLREFLRPVCEDMEVLKTSVYEAWKYFGPETEENIRKGFLEQGKIINSGTEAVLRRAINNGESLILETLYFIPSQLSPDILNNIRPLYIYIESKELNARRLLERENYTHLNSPGQRLADQLDRYRVMMNHSLDECREYGIATFENSDYMRTREQILEYVS